MPTASKRPRPGDSVQLIKIPSKLLDGLPEEDQQAIRESARYCMQLNEYDEYGRAELEFRDRAGTIQFIWVKPSFIKTSAAKGKRS